MEILISLEVFIIGLIFGSFINMAVYRVRQELPFSGRSFCDHTKKTLTWKDLFPIGSFIFYKGRCRHCSKKLPILYPIVEFITGLTFLAGAHFIFRDFLQEPWLPLNLTITVFYILVMLFFAVYDYLYWEVNVRAIKYSLITGIVFSIIALLLKDNALVIDGFSSLIAGFVSGLIILLVVRLTKGSGMGEGDIFLMALAGLAVGLDGLIPLFMISSISGSIIGIFKAIKIKKFHGVQIQFVPFISFATLVVFFWKDQILKLLYLDNFFSLFNI